MKKTFLNKILPFLLIAMTFTGCDFLSELDKNIDTNKLEGTWIDKESYALSFIDFYSNHEGSFCLYSSAFEQRDTFTYRIFKDSMAIRFVEDKDGTETLHKLVFKNNNTITISNLTDIPEQPDKVYYRKDIVTKRDGNMIDIGLNDLYYDKANDFRLEIDSVLNDSRCPIGAVCVWEGNAQVRFDLKTEGNYHYTFNLNTHRSFRQDTLIRGIRFKLIDVLPYPDINKTFNYQDYRVKISAVKE
ncbi:MAG: hypothetical protein QM800_01810 [Paludibacter sp.]